MRLILLLLLQVVVALVIEICIWSISTNSLIRSLNQLENLLFLIIRIRRRRRRNTRHRLFLLLLPGRKICSPSRSNSRRCIILTRVILGMLFRSLRVPLLMKGFRLLRLYSSPRLQVHGCRGSVLRRLPRLATVHLRLWMLLVTLLLVEVSAAAAVS